MTEVVMVTPDGAESWGPWTSELTCEAYRTGGRIIVRDSEPANVVCDFTRTADRVWQSPGGQQIRLFINGGYWQWTVDGMDVTDGTMHDTEADAREQAHACTDQDRWADFPLWDAED